VFANWKPSQLSGGHVDVSVVEIASRLNQYGNGISDDGIVPVAWRTIGVPTTGVDGAERLSVNPAADAALTGPASAVRPAAAATRRVSVVRESFI
jgi:hypothetical protein